MSVLSLTVGANGLFSLVKKLKGRTPTEISEQPNGVTIKVGDIEVTVPTEVFRLYKDKEINRLSQAVVEPLYRTGIDIMIIKQGNKSLETVTKDDAPSFTSASITDGTGTENIIPALALRLVSPTFNLNRNKWKLDDGGGSKWYGIEDEKFLREVREHNRRFGMDDYLICRVRTVQRITENKLEIERTILTVMEQRKAGEQLDFNTLP